MLGDGAERVTSVPGDDGIGVNVRGHGISRLQLPAPCIETGREHVRVYLASCVGREGPKKRSQEDSECHHRQA